MINQRERIKNYTRIIFDACITVDIIDFFEKRSN